MERIVLRNRSIIPACDVPFEIFERILEATHDNPMVGAYKIPHRAGRKGWGAWVKVSRKHTNKPLIYDGQKLGNDMPHIAEGIIEDLEESGINAIILYPMLHPKIEEAWIKSAQDKDLGVIVGGETTYGCLVGENERGYVLSSSAAAIYYHAAELGVTNFGVPGTKPDKIKLYKSLIESAGIKNPIFYSPGFVTQGGKIIKGVKAAGKRFHAIVGRGIYWNKKEERYNHVDEMRQATLNLTSKL